MNNNWAQQTTTTTGTGTLTLAAITGSPTIADVVGLDRHFGYAIVDDATLAPIESGIGVLASSTTMTRALVRETYASSVYTAQGASAVSLAAGTKRVIVTGLSHDISPAFPAVQGSYGSKIVVPDGLALAASTSTLNINEPVMSCLRWHCGAVIAQLCCEVTTSTGTGSDRIQLGIYAMQANGLPGNLIARTGDISPVGAAFKSASLAGGNVYLPPGWYYFAICSNVAVPVRAYNAGANERGVLGTPMGHVANAINARHGLVRASTLTGGWTALPSTVTLASAASILSQFPPTVGAIVA